MNSCAVFMPKGSPVVSIPEAQHHLLLDQPIAFISVIRVILKVGIEAKNLVGLVKLFPTQQLNLFKGITT